MASFNTFYLGQQWYWYSIPVSGAEFELRPSQGPGTLLAGRLGLGYSHDQIANADLAPLATSTKQTFFGESLLDAFLATSQAPIATTGTLSNVQKRIIVVSSLAFTIEAVLWIQLLLLLCVILGTWRTKRLLNLSADPATVIMTTKLSTEQQTTLDSLCSAIDRSSDGMDPWLAQQRYKLEGGKLHYLGPDPSRTPVLNHKSGQRKTGVVAGKSHYPNVLRLIPLLILTGTLAIILATIVCLFILSENGDLYQTAFVYQTGVSLSKMQLGVLNPASLVTTPVAVLVGLWWGSLDTSLRRFQPYLTMCQDQATGRVGSCLSYQSSYFIWSVVRAFSHGHWVLMFVFIGACLTQICTLWHFPKSPSETMKRANCF